MTLEDRVDRVRTLARSFRNAWRGVAFCIKNERNMRIHLMVGAYVLAFAPFYHFTRAEFILLLIVIGMVISAEAVNTAIEAAINLQTQWYDNIARIAKDVAAGAVLVCAFFAAAIGCILYVKPDILIHIVFFLLQNPLWGILFLLSIPAALSFIFLWPFHPRKNK